MGNTFNYWTKYGRGPIIPISIYTENTCFSNRSLRRILLLKVSRDLLEKHGRSFFNRLPRSFPPADTFQAIYSKNFAGGLASLCSLAFGWLLCFVSLPDLFWRSSYLLGSCWLYCLVLTACFTCFVFSYIYLVFLPGFDCLFL